MEISLGPEPYINTVGIGVREIEVQSGREKAPSLFLYPPDLIWAVEKVAQVANGVLAGTTAMYIWHRSKKSILMGVSLRNF